MVLDLELISSDFIISDSLSKLRLYELQSRTWSRYPSIKLSLKFETEKSPMSWKLKHGFSKHQPGDGAHKPLPLNKENVNELICYRFKKTSNDIQRKFQRSFEEVFEKVSRMFHVTLEGALKKTLEVASRRIQGCFEGALRFV